MPCRVRRTKLMLPACPLGCSFSLSSLSVSISAAVSTRRAAVALIKFDMNLRLISETTLPSMYRIQLSTYESTTEAVGVVFLAGGTIVIFRRNRRHTPASTASRFADAESAGADSVTSPNDLCGNTLLICERSGTLVETSFACNVHGRIYTQSIRAFSSGDMLVFGTFAKLHTGTWGRGRLSHTHR